MESISRRIVVRNKKTGRIGVVVDDLPGMFSCCTSEETPVVYEGMSACVGTLTDKLEVIGPENAVADPRGCGLGTEKDCCIFLGVNPSGFTCERYGPLRWSLIFRVREIGSQREPVALFPACRVS